MPHGGNEVNKFIIGTGFYSMANETFHRDCWARCIEKYYHKTPIYNVCLAGTSLMFYSGLDMRNIRLEGNNGHVGQLLSGEKPHEICGWSATVLALAMLAYCNESDLAYIEEDVIFKGDVIAKMYEELGEKKFIFGGSMKTAPFMPCSQSLFLIRHDFILRFIEWYIRLGLETHGNLPEHKFCKIATNWPWLTAYLPFGVDRERPIPWDDEYFYAQKLTAEEIQEAKRRGIV